MGNEVAIKSTNEVAEITDYKATVMEYLRGQGTKLPEKYLIQFINIAQAYGLNPFKREIYAVGYNDNYNIITGYEVFLKRAERTGKLNGWSTSFDGKVSFTKDGKLSVDSNLSCTITIYRKDWSMPFIHTVFIQECCGMKKDGTVNSMWRKMTSFMLKKVAIGQGFRMCFPDEMGGMPYLAEEIESEEEINVTPNYVESNPVDNKIAPTKPVQPVEPAQDVGMSESAMNLVTMLESYEKFCSAEVKNLCNEAIKSGDEAKISEMTDRLVSYLQRKKVI